MSASRDWRARDERLRYLFAGLSADATVFDFYYTLRTIDACTPGEARLGRAAHPQDEPLRITQVPSLVFAPGTQHRYVPAAAGGRGRLEVYHFGLYGPHGALPNHLTEFVQERQIHYKDTAIARFFDIFQHRAILLFYRAWADAQAVTNLDVPGRDSFSRYVASLAGYGQPALRNRDAVSDPAKLHHTGHLARTTRNVEGLVRALTALISAPVALKEFCWQWLHMSPAEQTQLRAVAVAGRAMSYALAQGAASQRLGLGAVLGRRVPDVQHRFRLRIGPLALHEFERYLPRQDRFAQVRDWVRNYVGHEFAWDAQLVLRKDEVPAARLGQHSRLGWTTWLGMKPGQRPRDSDDVTLDMERLSGVRAG